MYPVPIEQYYRPTSIREAIELATEASGECFFVAGGMSLMQAIKSRMIAPDCLIDLNGIDELRGITVSESGIRIGAMTRYRELAESDEDLAPYNALSDAAAHVGDRQVRNRGTIGGSLSWNYISACSPAATLACAATVEVLRANGNTDSISIDDFLIAPMTTALDEGDLLTAVVLPQPPTTSGSAYKKWGMVTDAIPVVGVAIHLELDSAGNSSSGRFVVCGLDNGPLRSSAAEHILTSGIDVTDKAALKACAAAAADEITTTGDHRISAKYKTQLIFQLGTEVLLKAAERARS